MTTLHDDGNQPVQPAQGGTTRPLFGRARWVVAALCLALFLGLLWLSAGGQATRFGWVCLGLVVTSLTGAATGAACGAERARSARYRELGVFPREAALRGARAGITVGWGTAWLLARTPGWSALFIYAGVGIISGLLQLWMLGEGHFLRDPEEHFGQACDHWRAGDTEAARQAIREYLQCADSDPGRAYRVPLAQRFLEDETASLEVATELAAAALPAGKGIEPEAACAPTGRGTEPEAAAEALPAAEDAQPQGKQVAAPDGRSPIYSGRLPRA